MTVGQFVAAYPPHPPSKAPAHADELRKLTAADGVSLLPAAPIQQVAVTPKPAKKGDPGCHLWVIDATGVPYILERAPVAPPLAGGRVKHTNLTGGGPAACGGELWFETSTRL